MIRFLLHRARTRSLLLAACETVLMVGAVVLAANCGSGTTARPTFS
jgi:hypothetical protein